MNTNIRYSSLVSWTAHVVFKFSAPVDVTQSVIPESSRTAFMLMQHNNWGIKSTLKNKRVIFDFIVHLRFSCFSKQVSHHWLINLISVSWGSSVARRGVQGQKRFPWRLCIKSFCRYGTYNSNLFYMYYICRLFHVFPQWGEHVPLCPLLFWLRWCCGVTLAIIKIVPRLPHWCQYYPHVKVLWKF